MDSRRGTRIHKRLEDVLSSPEDKFELAASTNYQQMQHRARLLQDVFRECERDLHGSNMATHFSHGNWSHSTRGLDYLKAERLDISC
jgi:hypothetical protein